MDSHHDNWKVTHQDERSVGFQAGAFSFQLTVCTATLVRVRVWLGSALPRRSWAVIRDDHDWQPLHWTAEEHGSVYQINLPAGKVVFERNDGTLRCVTNAGMVFCEDTTAARIDQNGATLAKAIADDEHFYGFGERTGPLDKRGQRYVNWTFDPEPHHSSRVDEMYAVFPIYLGLRAGYAYGVVFNTSFRSTFDIGASDPQLFHWATKGPEIDYYVSFGPTPASVVADWRILLGSTPLPPRWALGYHQSRWSYESEPIIRDLAAQFRGRQIPCDTIHFDIDYMNEYRVFTWNNERFPDPQGLIQDLARQGFNVVTIIDPGVKVDPDYSVYAEGVQHDMFIRRADGSLFSGYVWPDESVFADFTRAEVREWWGALHRSLVEAGVRGIWDDMNEPTVFDRPFSEGGGRGGTIDLDAPQGAADEQTTHAEVHNLYGLLMARATREGLLALRPDERPFVLTRSGFVGLQRWATLWTGDNSALWEHLEMTLPQLCNVGLSGVPFCGVDIGGFFGNATPELWARWIQIGAFLPFCRGHSCADTRPAEPWMHGERTEAIARAYITLRYRLLPYLYTLFHEAATTGAPIIRPMLYHFPGDPAVINGYDQAFCGPHLLLAPVVRPGFEHRAVYLPEGIWYDWWTGKRLTGPLHFLADAPLEQMPLYVRGGAIVPLGPAMQYTSERPLDELTLDIYPAGSSQWTFYEDDGISFAFEGGEWATTTIHCHETPGGIEVRIAARAGAWQPTARTWIINLHCPEPQRVIVDGRETSEWTFGDAALTLTLTDDGQPHTLLVEGA